MTSDLYIYIYIYIYIGHWYYLSPSLDVRFLAVIVTLNPCPEACLFNVCDNILTKEIHC